MSRYRPYASAYAALERRRRAAADSDPNRAAEDAALANAWSNIGDDLWQPGEGIFSKPFAEWLEQGCPPAFAKDKKEGSRMTATIRVSSACPACGIRHVMDVRETMEASPLGTSSVSGSQLKVTARQTWQYTCTECGASGECAAPGDLLTLANLPVAACGHSMATGHYAGDDHDAQSCPGCCPSCRRTKDASRRRRP